MTIHKHGAMNSQGRWLDDMLVDCTRERCERDANAALSDTAKMKRIDVIRHEIDDLEATQRMPVVDRRERAIEAGLMYLRGTRQVRVGGALFVTPHPDGHKNVIIGQDDNSFTSGWIAASGIGRPKC